MLCVYTYSIYIYIERERDVYNSVYIYIYICVYIYIYMYREREREREVLTGWRSILPVRSFSAGGGVSEKRASFTYTLCLSFAARDPNRKNGRNVYVDIVHVHIVFVVCRKSQGAPRNPAPKREIHGLARARACQALGRAVDIYIGKPTGAQGNRGDISYHIYIIR